MSTDTARADNWKTQIRKGYLELVLLLLIRYDERIYGLEILEKLKALDLPTKEGTLYPILNRLTVDGILSSVWETEGAKGHPRKFYSMTKAGLKLLDQMDEEFSSMMKSVQKLQRKQTAQNNQE